MQKARDLDITGIHADLVAAWLLIDPVFPAHKRLGILAQMDARCLCFKVRELLSSERVALLKDLAATLGAGFKVEWDLHKEWVKIELTS